MGSRAIVMVIKRIGGSQKMTRTEVLRLIKDVLRGGYDYPENTLLQKLGDNGVLILEDEPVLDTSAGEVYLMYLKETDIMFLGILNRENGTWEEHEKTLCHSDEFDDYKNSSIWEVTFIGEL